MNHPYRTASDEQRPQEGHVCTCCQRPWDVCIGATAAPGGLTRRQRTCPDCHGHGPSAMERDRTHIELWRAFLRSQQRDHSAKEALLQIRISDLMQELHDRPERIVERYVDIQELNEARGEARRAFRSRENAWQALCLVRLLHREGLPGQCRCGLRLDRCQTAQIVDHYPGLEEWEKEQVRRLRNGYDHNLPDGHPAVVDPRWQP